jgi:hypothetical protein
MNHPLNAKEYYYSGFGADFQNFWKKALHGPGYIKFTSFLIDEGYDALEDVSRDDLVYFLSALGYMIILDKTMFKHFPGVYPQFQKATGYPRIDIGWSRENPWIMFGQTMRIGRRITLAETQEKFAEFSEFYIKDLEQYFVDKFRLVAWEDVKKALLKEVSEAQGEYGRICLRQLANLA